MFYWGMGGGRPLRLYRSLLANSAYRGVPYLGAHPLAGGGTSGFASEWGDFGASGMGLFFSEERREY